MSFLDEKCKLYIPELAEIMEGSTTKDDDTAKATGKAKAKGKAQVKKAADKPTEKPAEKPAAKAAGKAATKSLKGKGKAKPKVSLALVDIFPHHIKFEMWLRCGQASELASS